LLEHQLWVDLNVLEHLHSVQVPAALFVHRVDHVLREDFGVARVVKAHANANLVHGRFQPRHARYSGQTRRMWRAARTQRESAPSRASPPHRWNRYRLWSQAASRGPLLCLFAVASGPAGQIFSSCSRAPKRWAMASSMMSASDLPVSSRSVDRRSLVRGLSRK